MSNEKIFQIDPIPAKTMASNMTSAPQDTNDGDDGMAMTAHDGIEVPMSSGITSVFDSTLPNLTSKQQLQDKPNTCDKNDHEDIASDVLFGEDCSNNELDSGDRTVVVASVICAKNSGSSDMKVDLPIPTPRYEDGVHVPGDNNGVDSIGDANDDFSDGASGVNLGLSKTPLSVERSQTLTAGEALPQRLVNTQTSSTVRHVINPPDDIQAKLDILESLTVDHEPTGSPAQQTMDDLVVDGVGDVSIKITALHDEMDNSMNRANLADDNVTTLESNVFEIIRDTTEHSLPKGNASIQNSGRHLAIRSIVTGSPSKLMNAGKPNKVTSHSTRMEEDVGKPRPKKRVKREKITIDKPLHERPLLSKKDSDQATALLSGKGDLADFLPREDCFILGKLWIFTAKQLSAALNSDSLPLGTPFRASYEEIIHELTHRNFQTRAPPIPVTQSANAEGNTATSGESIEVPSATDGTTTLGTTTTAIDDFHSTKVESSLSNAMDKIATWKEALDKYQTSVTKQEFNKCFRFDGALQILFPLSFLNFVRSARIETLWDFLSMKKTEAGAICEVMLIWRRECGLERIPHIGLARHFLSVANRVEAALSAIPSVPRNDRAWMKDPMNTLTGAGRDFLIFDQKIVSAVEFLSMRTKDASKNLESWREAKAMEPLKGSGNVAMISAWKTSVKEALEAESHPGRVVDLSRTMRKTNMSFETGAPPGGSPVKAEKKLKRHLDSQSATDRVVENALHSRSFLEGALGEKVAKLLLLGGIGKASELFDASKDSSNSTLFPVLKEAGLVHSVIDTNKIVEKWQQYVGQRIDCLGMKKSNIRNAQSKSPPPEKKSCPGTTLNLNARNVGKSVTTALREMNVNKTGDAFSSLSVLCRSFLASIGIRTAHAFLATRSTDISRKFINWRKSEGKPELKGVGAIASVSGWKSTVRKKAKELGLKELIDLEPTTRGAWGDISIAGTPKPSTSQEKEFPIDSSPVFEKMPNGNGLEVDRRVMFAVQHRDLLGHFVFELSIREQHEAGSLFVTYKGFGASNCTMTRAEKVELECGDIVGDASVDRRPGWILPDAEVTVVTSGSSENHDIRAPFSSLLSGCGLVNVGIHGAYPLHKQHLGLLKNVMESFVLNGDCTRNSQPTPFVDDKQNILIRKVAFDEYQYLLCLTQPVEKGQTFALSFPSISSCLGSRHYQVAKFPQRSGIDDSLRTLSLEDLRAVLAWLIDEGLPLTEYLNFLKITGSAAPSTFKQACERRRRLHWVSRRVTSAIGDRASANDRIMSNALRFGLQTLSEQDEENHLDAGQKIDLSDTLIEQVSFEMKFATEFDYTCGGRKRLEWCSKALNLFERVTDGLSKSYVLQAGSELPLLPRVNDCITGFLRSDDFSNADVLDEFVFYRSFTPTTGSSQFVPKLSDAMTANNKIALAQTLETVACVGEPSPGGTLSVVMRQPSVVKDGIATLSMDWYRTQFWQIVSTAIMYFFLVLEPEEVRKFEVDKVLGSIRPLVVIESKVKEPKAISYVNALPLVVSMRQNVEVVPGSYDIFLGLVWPALQKYNWRLIAGSSATEVSFCSASVTRKRKGALYQQRNRKRASLTRELNLTGLSAVSKTTKRVIVALVTDEGDFAGSNDSDTSSNANLSVKAIFDLFRTWLIDKFAADEDFSKVFATAKIVQVIRCLQTCFDACAPWLTPIRGLAPAHLDGCRPIEVYRCEYLMQFLLSLPTALLNGEQSKLLNASDCFGIVHDLFVFIAEQYSEIFDKRAHPPREEYVYGSDATSSLCAKIRSLLADGTSPSEETQSDAVHNFLVTEEEGVTLTDFLVCVQQQGLPFRATKDDVFKKNGRVNLGAPGIVCRHCLGQNNEGRYFFSSSESLTASYTVLEKHCLRCKKTPLDIKEKLVETRSRHQEQRKRLPIGSQQAYFNILWAKFLENKPGFVIGTVGDGTISIIDGDNGEIVSRSADSSSWSETAQDELTFSNHVDLLDNIRNSVKLKQKEEIQEALDRYYSCLDYAGRIFHTDSMPRHFSAHWLTSKVSPKLHHGYSIEDIV